MLASYGQRAALATLTRPHRQASDVMLTMNDTGRCAFGERAPRADNIQFGLAVASRTKPSDGRRMRSIRGGNQVAFVATESGVAFAYRALGPSNLRDGSRVGPAFFGGGCPRKLDLMLL